MKQKKKRFVRKVPSPDGSRNDGLFSGWYDRKEIGVFRHIIETNFVAAMGPPGGGRNPVTPRLMRHFHYIAFTELEDNSKVITRPLIRENLIIAFDYYNSVHAVIMSTF